VKFICQVVRVDYYTTELAYLRGVELVTDDHRFRSFEEINPDSLLD